MDISPVEEKSEEVNENSWRVQVQRLFAMRIHGEFKFKDFLA